MFTFLLLEKILTWFDLTGWVFMLMTRLWRGFASSGDNFGCSSNGCFLWTTVPYFCESFCRITKLLTLCNRAHSLLAHGCWSQRHNGGSPQRQPLQLRSWSCQNREISVKWCWIQKYTHDSSHFKTFWPSSRGRFSHRPPAAACTLLVFLQKET